MCEAVSHPFIVKVFELLHDEMNFYIVTEYAKEGTLYSFLNNIIKMRQEMISEA